MTNNINISKPKINCFHCGDECPTFKISVGEKYFCCNGCKLVFEILSENELCNYYALNEFPGSLQKNEIRKEKFDFLDNLEIEKKLIDFKIEGQTQVTFYIPQIHCSSCLWLLENLHKVTAGIISSRVDFVKKEVFIAFDNTVITLRKLVETLSKIGYEPHLRVNDGIENKKFLINRTRWYKIGLSGFCFGNIMMMSLAEYFDFDQLMEPKINLFFRIVSLLLSIPVLFYAASEFFISAWNGLKGKIINIDFPISLALIITFGRSTYEIFNGISNGYLDSLSGIVFFMLIGRWLQEKTYKTISFDRDFRSFFPLAVQVKKNNKIIPTEINEIKEHDIIQIHSNEIIPVDAIVSKGSAKIDYSFVSGESLPVQLNIGELVYAGGRQLDGIIELLVVKEVSQSYLTNLWNNPVFNKKNIIKATNIDLLGKYFTLSVLLIGILAGLYWFKVNQFELMWNAITTVLIVACPCALLLSSNFTYGNIIRILGLNKFYLKSPEIIASFSKINHIVFDKTGTLTQNEGVEVNYKGKDLTKENKQIIASLLHHSGHPLSKIVFNYLNERKILEVVHYKEVIGLGIEGWINEAHIKIGSPSYIGGNDEMAQTGAQLVISVEGEIIGRFIIGHKYRWGLVKLFQQLKEHYSISLISGDNDYERENIKNLLGNESLVYFNQSPQEKLNFIKELQTYFDKKVMMVGDGLNDAGALKQSDIGIVVSDSSNNFTPACDAIIDASKIHQLGDFIQFSKMGKMIILFSFFISLGYNIVGLYYAIQGNLSPLIAAILMPLSSITIILITYGLSEFFAKRYKLK